MPLVHPHSLQSAVAFAVRAREAGLESIVQMSQWTAHRNHPANLTRQIWLMDRLFADLPGNAHTVINPGMFADNFLRTIDFAALLGIYPVLSGHARSAPVSNEDIARAVVAVLEDPAPHAGKAYRPTRPDLLSAQEMAQVIAKVVGHRVLPVQLPYSLFNKVARHQGVDALSVSVLRHYMKGDMKGGAFEFEGGVTDDLGFLTGVPAESFETTARRYAALPFAQQTAANRLKALANFMITPMLPGYNLSRIERNWGMPLPPNASYGIQDRRWREERSALANQKVLMAR